MSYSCGYFRSDTDTLYDAQCNKVDRTLEKLHLQEGMTLCDIGCGWGFLLIQAAKKYKVHGVGITLSEEQKRKQNAESVKNIWKNMFQSSFWITVTCLLSELSLTVLSVSGWWSMWAGKIMGSL